MITKSAAVELGMELGRRQVYSPFYRNKDGSFTNCRVNGKCKIWKSRPLEFRLPIKIGFKGHGYINHMNADDWYLNPEDAMRSTVIPITYRKEKANDNQT